MPEHDRDYRAVVREVQRCNRHGNPRMTRACGERKVGPVIALRPAQQVPDDDPDNGKENEEDNHAIPYKTPERYAAREHDRNRNDHQEREREERYRTRYALGY